MSLGANPIITTKNTVYARPAFGLEQFEWAGLCSFLDDIEQDLGGLNPSLCQGPNGGVQVSGFNEDTPGLASTTFSFKEQVRKALGDKLKSCYWDLDRRYHCDGQLSMWNKWDKILRVALGKATGTTYRGSSIDQAAEDAIATVAWSAVGECIIERTSMSVQTFGGGT